MLKKVKPRVITLRSPLFSIYRYCVISGGTQRRAFLFLSKQRNEEYFSIARIELTLVTVHSRGNKSHIYIIYVGKAQAFKHNKKRVFYYYFLSSR